MAQVEFHIESKSTNQPTKQSINHYTFNLKCNSFKIQAGFVDTLSWAPYICSCLLEIEVYVAIWVTFLLVY